MSTSGAGIQHLGSAIAAADDEPQQGEEDDDEWPRYGGLWQLATLAFSRRGREAAARQAAGCGRANLSDLVIW